MGSLYTYQPFLQATEHMEYTNRPLLYQVLPMFDIMDDHLEAVARNDSLYTVTRTAAARMLTVLNKYYSKTDESIMYRASLSKFILCSLTYSHDLYK